MAEGALGGNVSPTLTRLYEELGSWELVARRLHTDHSLIVSGQTLRRWAKQLNDEAREPAA